MSLFTLDQEKMERLLLAGLKEELAAAMRNQYGTGQKLREMVSATIAANEKAIEQQIKVATIAAIESPAFVELVRDAMLQAMRGKFAGAFEGVMRAAGKKAAQDQLLTDGIVKGVAAGTVAQNATQVEPPPPPAPDDGTVSQMEINTALNAAIGLDSTVFQRMMTGASNNEAWCVSMMRAALTEAAKFRRGQTDYKKPAIPDGVYYSLENDNFYEARTRKGMGQAFYYAWRHRAAEFPRTGAADPEQHAS